MKVVLAAALVLFLAAPAALADKAEVIKKIEALLEEGHLDEAKSAIDHYLKHNPEDPDLLHLLEVWRFRRSGAGALLHEEGLAEPAKRKKLREICWRIVSLTAAGNSEEWSALADLLDGPDREKAEKLLAELAAKGTESEKELIRKLSVPPPTVPPDRRKYIPRLKKCKNRDEALAVLRDAENVPPFDDVKPYLFKIFKEAEDPELRFTAAAVLLRMGEESPRKTLVAALEAERPVDAVEAAKVLLRYPRPTSPHPRQDLFKKIEEDEAILRAKPTLLSLTVDAIARYGEEGALEFLLVVLRRPDLATDAARAVGELGDPSAVPALLDFLTNPPTDDEPTGGGLGYLDRATGTGRTAEEMRPSLVGALAILRAIDNEE